MSATLAALATTFGAARFPLAAAVRASAPAGVRLYAVGDIHGRLDLFEALLLKLAVDHASRPPAAAEIILLGDYIDRGRHSAHLLDRFLEGPPPWASWTLLRGNHEQTLLDIFDTPMREDRDALIANWLRFGGTETLISYGADGDIASGKDAWATGSYICTAIPAGHRALLRSTPLSACRGGYVFVHAGIRPGVSLDEQAHDDLLWIRDEFLDCPDDHGAVVVHGHSISREPQMLANRIGIDTGAYQSGVLTALVLEGEERRLIATGGWG